MKEKGSEFVADHFKAPSTPLTTEEILETYLIVTTVNKNYLKIFDLWYHYFRSTKYVSILKVITLDDESDSYLRKNSISTIPIKKSTSNFSKIVQWRFEVIYELLRQGKNIIHTDSDAIWINLNLTDIIDTQYDFQVSIGYGIPQEAVSKWGFSLCTGFLIFHSNENVLSFTKKWIEECTYMLDDQKAFNRLLLSENIEWKLTSKTKNYGVSKQSNLRIQAIDFFVVSRVVLNNIAVFHPFLSSNHQYLKVIDLIIRLKKIDNSPFLDHFFNSIIYNPFGWVISTYRWVSVLYYKVRRRLKTKNTSVLLLQ